MKVKLAVICYKGVDGSSLSETRCFQIVQVYEMLNNMGNESINYLTIQEKAERLNLFQKAGAKSAIRTFFPLLKKLQFVNYEGYFPACKCFTELGTQFVLASRALFNVSNDLPNREEIIKKIKSIKCNAQKQGLLNMYQNPECKKHNIWIALRLFFEFRMINWNEFLYAIYRKHDNIPIDKIIHEIGENMDVINTYEFTNEKGDPLPNTCFAYIRSFLEETELISKISTKESVTTDSFDEFYSQLNI